MKIFFDSAEPNMVTALQNILDAVGYPKEESSLTDEKFWECFNRVHFQKNVDLNDFLADNFDLIVQHISEREFRAAFNDGFRISNNSGNSDGHPLFFRCAYREAERIPLPTTGERRFAENKYNTLCLPILYVTDFEIGHRDHPDSAFLDSSIWHRAVNIKNPLFLSKLKDRLDDFKKWHTEKLYNRMVALETLDYHIRMLQEQRLPIKDGHGFTSLGSWASESKFEQKFIDEKRSIQSLLPRKFLLVDDYASTELREYATEKSRIDPLSKENIEENNIEESSKTAFVWNALNAIYQGQKFELGFATDIKRAKDLINETAYDVILLDYNLGGNIEDRGTELLHYVKENSAKPPLLGKFWVFGISAFPSAMLAEIASGKLQPSESTYHFHPGADPITTPCLFKYNLLQFLKFQQEEAAVQTSSSKSQDIIESFISSAFLETHARYVGQRARERYHDFVGLRNTCERLLENSKKGSLFARYALRTENLEGTEKSRFEEKYKHFLAELHHLIFLLAYETGYNWEKMWEQYLNVLDLLSRIRVLQTSSQTDDKFDHLSTIREYIIELQKNSR